MTSYCLILVFMTWLQETVCFVSCNSVNWRWSSCCVCGIAANIAGDDLQAERQQRLHGEDLTLFVQLSMFRPPFFNRLDRLGILSHIQILGTTNINGSWIHDWCLIYVVYAFISLINSQCLSRQLLVRPLQELEHPVMQKIADATADIKPTLTRAS